jgi:hypothetical protein
MAAGVMGPAVVLAAMVTTTACATMSETRSSESVGLNGGFEETRDGLPVNWLVSSPETIPEGDYGLLFDAEDSKEGRQSLRFAVSDCLPTGGWKSPGFARELPAVPGATSLLSSWVENEETDYAVSAGSVSAKTGSVRTVASSNGGVEPWKRVEIPVTVNEEQQRLRLELSIRSAGSLWIDDVGIEAIEGEPATLS